MTMSSCASLPPPPVALRTRHLHCADDVIETTAAVYGLTRSELLAKDRHRTVAEARQVAMMITRDLTRMSFPELARAFGVNNHTTVLCAVRRARELTEEEEFTRVRVLEILRRLDPVVGLRSCGRE